MHGTKPGISKRAGHHLGAEDGGNEDVNTGVADLLLVRTCCVHNHKPDALMRRLQVPHVLVRLCHTDLLVLEPYRGNSGLAAVFCNLVLRQLQDSIQTLRGKTTSLGQEELCPSGTHQCDGSED